MVECGLALKDLYTDIKARVLFAGSLSREFNISIDTESINMWI